jgi:hypothetical protein
VCVCKDLVMKIGIGTRARTLTLQICNELSDLAQPTALEEMAMKMRTKKEKKTTLRPDNGNDFSVHIRRGRWLL